MIKILIFVSGRDLHNLNPALQKFSTLYPNVNISIVGSTGVYPLMSQNQSNILFIPVKDIINYEFDFIGKKSYY